MSKFDYVAIDFETANEQLCSACSIGIVAVKNDKVIESGHFLINPEMSFSDYNITIHQITPEDVLNEPNFGEVWQNIKKYFDDEIIFAHSASFDVAVLKALIERYSLDVPNIKVGCTLKIAQKIWKTTLPNCKLNTLSHYLGVEHDHHNALSDAIICTEIIKRAKRVRNVASEAELFESLGIAFGFYNQLGFKMVFSKLKQANKEKVIKNETLKDKVIAFSGKPKTMTKKELSEKILINGAWLSKTLDRSVDYFVALQNCPKTKIDQVNLLKQRGSTIQVITEETIKGWFK